MINPTPCGPQVAGDFVCINICRAGKLYPLLQPDDCLRRGEHLLLGRCLRRLRQLYPCHADFPRAAGSRSGSYASGFAGPKGIICSKGTPAGVPCFVICQQKFTISYSIHGPNLISWRYKQFAKLEFVGVNDENFIYDWWHYGSWKNNCVPTAQTGFTE